MLIRLCHTLEFPVYKDEEENAWEFDGLYVSVFKELCSSIPLEMVCRGDGPNAGWCQPVGDRSLASV